METEPFFSRSSRPVAPRYDGVSGGRAPGIGDGGRQDAPTPGPSGLGRWLEDAAAGPRGWRAALLLIPGLWLGLLTGISLIEAPLKFTAPGITIPLGLGIGRRVFFAMNLVELVLAAVLVVALLRTAGRPAKRPFWGWSAGILAVYAVKVLVIRPILNVRTDAVLAGQSAGGSMTHLFYIAADGILLVLLIALAVTAARALLPAGRRGDVAAGPISR